MQQARKGSQLLNIYRRHWLVGIAIAGILSCYAMLGLNQSVQAKPNLSSGNGSSAVQHQYGIAVDCVFCHVNSDGGADDTDFNIYGADLHNWFKGLSPRDTHSPRLLAN